jgi:hypothetical protein
MRSRQANSRLAPLEVLLAFLAAAAFYGSLYGELPYHDVADWVRRIDSGRFLWDAGHIFLQPTALLWHHYLGFGESAETSLKHINTVATAAGIAVFYLLMLQLGISRWQRIAASILVAASCGVMTLAPSGHPKLLDFPFLNGSILLLTIWEMRSPRPEPSKEYGLCAAALLLALAATFHASCLSAAPFATVALLLISLRSGEGWGAGLRRAALFAGICGIAFLLFFVFGYIAIVGQSPTIQALLDSILKKEHELRPFVSLKDILGRLIFGTGNTFIAAPFVGSIIRAWLAGFIPSLRPYAGRLALEIGPWLATSVLIAIIYVRSVWRIAAGARGLVPLAFLCGATAWAVYVNLNDPEHWIAFLVPTVILLLIEFPVRLTRSLIVVWAIITAAVNLAEVGIPVAIFPLHAAEAQIRARYGPRDLLVAFAQYPGTPYLGFFKLPGLRELKLDLLYRQAGNNEEFFAVIDKAFTDTWKNGGRVVMFDVLDPYNWDAPWFELSEKGLTKRALRDFLTSHYTVLPLGKVGGLEAWEITR